MEKEQPRYLRISEITRQQVPFSQNTLYSWKCKGKHPELFRKVGGALFIDLEALQKLFDESTI